MTITRITSAAHRWLVLVAACAVFVVAGAGTAQAARVEPGAFVQALGDKTIDVIKEPESSPDERKRHVRDLLSEYFDLDTIGRFVLGRHWRAATPAQRRQYVTLFRTFVLESYALRLESFRKTISRASAMMPAGFSRPSGFASSGSSASTSATAW